VVQVYRDTGDGRLLAKARTVLSILKSIGTTAIVAAVKDTSAGDPDRGGQHTGQRNEAAPQTFAVVTNGGSPSGIAITNVQVTNLTPGVAWPLPNVWLGVSVEDQTRADLRIPALLSTPAAVRWLSCEPLLAPVDLHQAIVPMGEQRGHGQRRDQGAHCAGPPLGGSGLRHEVASCG
jgi:hypothetical protein